eukprot:5913815-Amphidinium_carterae.1
MTKFRMVAELLHRLLAGYFQGPHHEVQQQAEHRRVPGYDPVNAALLVKSTLLDPTSVSTTTWSTSTRCSGDINMLTVPKQQPHRRKLPFVFEGNKQDQTLRPTTTFKNWAAELQSYMLLEDHNLATLMENVTTQTLPINDASYIDHKLHQQGLGHEDAEKTHADELRRLLRVYTTRTEPILRRNEERRLRRQAG